MNTDSEFIRSEISEIAHIFQDECWLEGERRGASVDRSDPTVQARVAEIILTGIGAQLRIEHSLNQKK